MVVVEVMVTMVFILVMVADGMRMVLMVMGDKWYSRDGWLCL